MSLDIFKRVLFFGLAAALLFSSCTSRSKNRDQTPTVYRGGQYYGDAIHE
jgi:hypothetical protein